MTVTIIGTFSPSKIISSIKSPNFCRRAIITLPVATPASHGVATDNCMPVLSPLLSVVPGQLFAAALSRAKGLDADQPVGLTKVTLAQ